MKAEIVKMQTGYIATFKRHWNHSVEEVWSWLTDNQKLTQWFSELEIERLQEGGLIKFDMQDGTFEEMRILALDTPTLLEFTWGEDRVRFELSSEDSGCQLKLIETLNTITDHTPKDLAGWHICLDVIEALLNGSANTEFRMTEWEKWYEIYKATLEKVE